MANGCMMSPLDLVKLAALMARARGRPEVRIGLIDGPVATGHPDLAASNIQEVPGRIRGYCAQVRSAACAHGTFVAGILCGKRGSAAPAICPGCTLLVHPVFAETDAVGGKLPDATTQELAAALIGCIEAGARVVNLSLALAQSSATGKRELQGGLNYAMQRGVLVVAAAGNQAAVGSSLITGHPWVIPVAACDSRGRPMNESNLGSSIGRRGLSAPGDGIT